MRSSSLGLGALVVWLAGCQGATLPGSTAGASVGMDSDSAPGTTSGILPPPTMSAGLDTSTGPDDATSTATGADSTTATSVDTSDDAPATDDGGTTSTSGVGSSEGSSSESSSSGDPPDQCQPILVEVFYDPESADDMLEWVRLHNPCATSRDLVGHSLGWGGTDYTYGTLDLAGVIPAGGCFTVGGPLSSVANASPVLDQAIDLNPDMQNSGATADGLALFDVPAAMIAAGTVPIDAVVYGTTNDSGLLGPDGSAPVPHVGDAPTGSALRRSSLMPTWVIDVPMPAACPPF